jgi:hypothetical protein
LGVVVGCSPPVFTVGVELPAGVDALAVGVELLAVAVAPLAELAVELGEDPQPTATATAAQVISVDAIRFIAAATLA